MSTGWCRYGNPGLRFSPLSDYLDLSSYNGRKSLPEYGLGRNPVPCSRKRACGPIKRSGRAGRITPNGWPLVLTGHQDITPSSSSRSPANEVRHTAKSIAKWTHQHLKPRRVQRGAGPRRGAKGGKVSKGGEGRAIAVSDKSDLLPEVLRLKAQGYTNRDIADDLQISPSTVSVYLKRDRP
ncbi:helix-turn-helix domain-containing protein [Klebsiella pneumoniae]|uniref:helix-turn-helix domain-containing protein n=1 Tax=Klebsiella pneumoniae TaxID=573 RepID=UPI003A5CEC0A